MPPRAAEEAPPGFEVIRELGRGGIGVVVLARHRGLDRLTAVKRLLASPDSGSDAVARFRREARALARMDHPSVVRLYDVVASGGRLFIVMEYVDSTDLRRHLDAGTLGPAAAVRALDDIAAALDHAAARGVVHRDLKPANVFVLPDGRAKLGDFGIARVLGDAVTFHTATGTAIGSAAYMAPEQILGDSEITAATDVYAFSVMAYEATVGRLPYPPGSLEHTVDAHLHGAPTPPHELVPDYPRAAAAALSAGMAKDPDDRPPILDIAAALRAVPPSAWPAPAFPTERHRPSDLEVPAITTESITAFGALPPGSARRPSPEPESDRGLDNGGSDDGGTDRSTDDAPWIEPPVFRPVPTGRRRHHVAIAAVVFLIASLTWFGVDSLRSTDSSLKVRSASVTVAPASGRGACPTARFSFTARVQTNGRAGTVRFIWTTPDGVVRAPLAIAAPEGPKEVRAVLRFQISGPRSMSGRPTLRVLKPSRLIATGTEVMYSCP